MHDNSLEDALNALADALAVTPSADGPARVRMRVADMRPRWVSTRWVGIAAVAASVVAAVTTMSIATRDRRQSLPAPSAAIAPHATVTRSPLASVIPAPALVARPPSRPRVDRVVPPPEPEAPEVLVSPDQMVAFQQLRVLLQSGRLDPAALLAVLAGPETGIGSPGGVVRPPAGGPGGRLDPLSKIQQERRFANN